MGASSGPDAAIRASSSTTAGPRRSLRRGPAVLVGVGYLLDLLVGSDRTRALAVAALGGELVAPFYQLYSVQKAKGAQRGAVATAAVLGSVAMTVLVRLPLSLAVVWVALRDAALVSCVGYVHNGLTLAQLASAVVCTHAKRSVGVGVAGPSASQADALALDEVQPWLLLPSALGGLAILWLDCTWLRKWSLPLLRRAVRSKGWGETKPD